MRTTSPYMEFYEEILNMKTDFGEVGVEEDVLGVDQVEVYFLEGGGNGGETGLVKIDLETISELVSQLARKSFLSTASLIHILISRPQNIQSQLASSNKCFSMPL